MHPHIPAEDNNTLLPLIHHFLQTQKPEQSCSCTALAAPAGFCSVPCSGDTATPPSPPRAGAQQADEIRTGSWQRKCFERSSLTHEKCSSSPAGKERKKAQPPSHNPCRHCPLATAQSGATTTGHPSPSKFALPVPLGKFCGGGSGP